MEKSSSTKFTLPSLSPARNSYHEATKQFSLSRAIYNSKPIKQQYQQESEDNAEFLRELLAALSRFVSETEKLECQTNEPINFKRLAERFESDTSKDLIKVLIPEAFLEGRSQSSGVLSAPRILKRLVTFYGGAERIGFRNILNEVNRISEFIKERCLADFKNKVGRCVANIKDKQRQLYDKKESPEHMDLREFVSKFSVENGRWVHQTPVNERLKMLEPSCSRFSGISRSLLEQDRILSQAIRAKRVAQPSFFINRVSH